MAKIFISYRREDTESHANHLKSELENYVGKGKVFLDSKDIPPGRDWSDVLQRSVMGSDYLLALIGPKWLNIEDSQTKERRLDNPDDVVRKEIRGALQNKRVRVVPVLVGDAPMPGQNDLPDELKELASRQNFELRQRRWEDDVRALAEQLKLIPRSTLAKSRTGIKVAASLVPAALIYGLVVVPNVHEIKDLSAKALKYTQEIDADAQKIKDLNQKVTELTTPKKVVEGFVSDNNISSNVIWLGKKGEEIPVTLYGVTDLKPDIEKAWMAKHPEKLSCRVVGLGNSLVPSYRCLVANTFDLSEALLLNRGASALPDAPPSYRAAAARAGVAKRYSR